MADNVTSNPGSGGPTWATDDIGGIHYPRFKLTHGADGSAVDASTAAPLPVVQTGAPALPTGAATEATLAQVVTAVDGLEASVGAPADAAASSDTGSFGLIALFKRALQNWTALLSRIPALASGRVPVDGSGVTQPVSAASLPLPTGAATAANQSTSNTSLSSIDTKLPSQVIPGLLPVDTLGQAGVARQLAATATSASTALTTTCRRVSIYANGIAIRYSIGTGTQTASATSHFIGANERLDLDVPANAQIGVLRVGSTDGVLEVTELV